MTKISFWLPKFYICIYVQIHRRNTFKFIHFNFLLFPYLSHKMVNILCKSTLVGVFTHMILKGSGKK